ncbi:MAG: hypothetical protein ABJE95_17340 [Byssovorax sp.]
MRRIALLAAPILVALGCSSSDTKPVVTPPPDPETGTMISFDLAAKLGVQSSFYDLPYPSDLRLNATGGPDLTGFPFPGTYEVFNGIRKVAMDQHGFPVIPVAYFRLSADLPALDAGTVIAADKASPILLIDVDEASSERGKLFPVVATVPPKDGYVRVTLLATAPRPGIVLHPKRKYAFVVQKSLKDAAGKGLGAPAALTDLEAGKAPAGDFGTRAAALYASLWSTLPMAGVDVKNVAGATVFTTGDVVAELADLSDKLKAKYPVTIDNLAVDPDDGATHDGYCELIGKVTYPQFQKGKPAFDSDGLFEYTDGGLPAKQRDEDAPLTITIPKGEMPAGGFPLVVFFHGSGGKSTAIVDRGTWRPESDPAQCPDGGHMDEWMGVTGCNTKGEGPAWVLAPHGFAMVGSALPVNPERVPNASETAYLNFNNLAAGHDLFRQGVIEQRMLIDAMGKLQIDPKTLGMCTGSTLPPGETKFHFNVDKKLFAQGQSMGGQYTNLVSAVEPRIRAAVPTGAGGYWSHFILITPLIPDVASKVGNIILGTKAELTFMHPALSVFETAWEAVDPMVYMPRLARRPLSGHPVRPIYEPAGKGDSYFPEATYDAMALAYGHKEAGSIVWPSMQEALKLEGLSGIEPYPVSNNLTSEDGTKYTGAVLQYEGDGVYDPHALYSQREEVKFQYSCFLESFLKTGVAKIPAPGKLGTACP